MNCLSIIIQQIYFYRIQINHYTFFQSIDLLTQVPIKILPQLRELALGLENLLQEFFKNHLKLMNCAPHKKYLIFLASCL